MPETRAIEEETGALRRLTSPEPSAPAIIGVVSEFKGWAGGEKNGRRDIDADIFELRLDLADCAAEEFPDICRRAGEVFQRPLLATVRHASEGGGWDRGEEERRACVRNIIPHISAVDLELAFINEFAEELALAREKGVVTLLSFHDFNETPEKDRMEELLRQAEKAEVDVFKIAAAIQGDNDLSGLADFAAMKSSIGKIVIPMNEEHPEYRLAFLLVGSNAGYAFIDGPSVAPGQLPASLFKEFLASSSSKIGCGLETAIEIARDWLIANNEILSKESPPH